MDILDKTFDLKLGYDLSQHACCGDTCECIMTPFMVRVRAEGNLSEYLKVQPHKFWLDNNWEDNGMEKWDRTTNYSGSTVWVNDWVVGFPEFSWNTNANIQMGTTWPTSWNWYDQSYWVPNFDIQIGFDLDAMHEMFPTDESFTEFMLGSTIDIQFEVKFHPGSKPQFDDF